jgi:TonB family protein
MVVGDGTVLVEIELTRAAMPRNYRVLSPRSGFDDAALAAVKTWRFGPPSAPNASEQIFVYALLGFRTPVVGR